MNIDGVTIIPKRIIPDERGAIFHMLRNDSPEFKKFGEIYFSKVYPGIVKGWHIHSRMELNYLLVYGQIKFVLYDDRPESPTRGRVQEIDLSDGGLENKLVTGPPFVWNGFKGIGSPFSIVANCATEPHDPEEISRREFNDPYFPYKW